MSRGAIFETLVGAVVLAAAAAFIWYGYVATGARAGAGEYRLSAVFGRVDGVEIGSDVTIAGVKVGAVAESRLDPKTYEARLDLALSKGVAVPDDSSAKIVSDGLIGGAHVSIEPGASETMLADGGVIALTQGSVDLLGLAVQAFTSGKGTSSAPSSATPAGDADGTRTKPGEQK